MVAMNRAAAAKAVARLKTTLGCLENLPFSPAHYWYNPSKLKNLLNPNPSPVDQDPDPMIPGSSSDDPRSKENPVDDFRPVANPRLDGDAPKPAQKWNETISHEPPPYQILKQFEVKTRPKSTPSWDTRYLDGRQWYENCPDLPLQQKYRRLNTGERILPAKRAGPKRVRAKQKLHAGIMLELLAGLVETTMFGEDPAGINERWVDIAMKTHPPLHRLDCGGIQHPQRIGTSQAMRHGSASYKWLVSHHENERASAVPQIRFEPSRRDHTREGVGRTHGGSR